MDLFHGYKPKTVQKTRQTRHETTRPEFVEFAACSLHLLVEDRRTFLELALQFVSYFHA